MLCSRRAQRNCSNTLNFPCYCALPQCVITTGSSCWSYSPQTWSHLRPLCPAGQPVHTGPWQLGAPLPAASRWLLHRWWWSHPDIKKKEKWASPPAFISFAQKIYKTANVTQTPMSSTNILSRPTGPRELLTMLAMDAAAMTAKKGREPLLADN